MESIVDVLTLSRTWETLSFEFSCAFVIKEITLVMGASNGKLFNLAKLWRRADWAPAKTKYQ